MIDGSRFIDDLMTIKQSRYGSEMRQAIYECIEYLGSSAGASRELTSQEYENLPASTKNNGMVYYIKNTGEIYKDGRSYGGSTFNAGNFQAVVLSNPVALAIAGNATIPE